MKKTIITVAATLVAELIVFVIVVGSGFSGALYNVSTLSPDPGFLHWIFSSTSDNSVKYHARGIKVPALNDSSMIAEGFDHYNDMCVTCHAGPGLSKSEAGIGIYPQAPNLAKSAKQLPPQDLFWVIKNGIKSTGMPGFAKTHTDDKIWAMVAFLEQMKNMTPEQYQAMDKANEGMKNMKMNMKMDMH